MQAIGLLGGRSSGTVASVAGHGLSKECAYTEVAAKAQWGDTGSSISNSAFQTISKKENLEKVFLGPAQ